MSYVFKKLKYFFGIMYINNSFQKKTIVNQTLHTQPTNYPSTHTKNTLQCRLLNLRK